MKLNNSITSDYKNCHGVSPSLCLYVMFHILRIVAVYLKETRSIDLITKIVFLLFHYDFILSIIVFWWYTEINIGRRWASLGQNM
jgi:hypothetical protein